MINSQDFEDLKEQLAAIEHARWSQWQTYLHGKCTKNSDGSLTIPKELVDKWDIQSRTEYAELTDKEKKSDREQVDKYFSLLRDFVLQNSN
jgi:hypothetical protein